MPTTTPITVGTVKNNNIVKVTVLYMYLLGDNGVGVGVHPLIISSQNVPVKPGEQVHIYVPA